VTKWQSSVDSANGYIVMLLFLFDKTVGLFFAYIHIYKLSGGPDVRKNADPAHRRG
jgi:hypothetical protein